MALIQRNISRDRDPRGSSAIEFLDDFTVTFVFESPESTSVTSGDYRVVGVGLDLERKRVTDIIESVRPSDLDTVIDKGKRTILYQDEYVVLVATKLDESVKPSDFLKLLKDSMPFDLRNAISKLAAGQDMGLSAISSQR